MPDARHPATGGRLRVLHVGKFYTPHRGGMETHLQTLCERLRESVDLAVVVASPDRRTTREIVEGVSVTRVGTLLRLRGTSLSPALVRAIRDADADIVHVHHPNPAAVLAFLAARTRGRLVVSYHSDIVRQRILGRLFAPVLHHALGRSAAITCASPHHVTTSHVLSPHRARCVVIPYGIPTAPLDRCDAAAAQAIRDRHGPRLVLGVGRLVGYKGFRHLIDAMADVRGRLVIVGDGPLRPALEAQILARGLADRVTLLGAVDDVAPFYHAADVFALPSVTPNEAFGIVQLEAMACGRPVVNTALRSAVPFVSLDGVTGVTVPPADARALARALNALLDDPERRGRLGDAARQRVHDEFSVEVMTSRTLELYDRVMRGQPPSSGAPS
jgi:glycosyltransferase involved in cell wall biosynthesis